MAKRDGNHRCFKLAGLIVLAFGFVVQAMNPAYARVRLEHICMIQGQQEVRLTGLGLVVGLAGTGDGGRNLPTVRALRAAMLKMNLPTSEVELRSADNVAVVMIEATIPRSGIRRGQKIDCHISALMGAKNLRGGRLLSTPLTTAQVQSDLVVGIASGGLAVEDIQRPTTAKIAMGVELLEDVTTLFINKERSLITLLIDPAHASFWTSSEVARVVNSEFSFESSGRQVAKPVGPGAVEVQIPQQYRDLPVEFVAQVLEVGIDNPTTQARVVLNSRTGTVIVTGEVQVSPCAIAHKNFSIELGVEGVPPSPGGAFPGDPEGDRPAAGQQFRTLIDALKQLQVPTADIIAIIRELHATGKLHAELIDH